MPKKPIYVSEDTAKIVKSFADEREMDHTEAAEYMIKVAHGRLGALSTYNTKIKKKLAKLAAKRAAKRKARQAAGESAAA